MSIDLNSLKNSLKTVLDAANTTTASVDLSSGLNRRVQKVVSINPNRIPLQASWYPFVTSFIDRKSIEFQGMAGSQLSAKRESEIDLKIVGAVWNSKINDNTKDPADDDCEKLMESIEEIIRRNQNLSNSTIVWSRPTDVAYHNVNLDEGVHIRAGILNLKLKVYY